MKSLLLLLDISNFVYICLSVLSIIVEANCVPVPWGSDAIVSHWDDIKFVFNQIEKWGGGYGKQYHTRERQETVIRADEK